MNIITIILRHIIRDENDNSKIRKRSLLSDFCGQGGGEIHRLFFYMHQTVIENLAQKK
jgi:hypothetical protein